MSDDRGAVTAEVAVLLPLVVLLLVAVLGFGTTAVAQLRCADAARAGARAAAIGDDDGEVAAVARRVAGAGADVTVHRSDGWVVVHVERSTSVLGLRLGVRLDGEATAREEP